MKQRSMTGEHVDAVYSVLGTGDVDCLSSAGGGGMAGIAAGGAATLVALGLSSPRSQTSNIAFGAGGLGRLRAKVSFWPCPGMGTGRSGIGIALASSHPALSIISRFRPVSVKDSILLCEGPLAISNESM